MKKILLLLLLLPTLLFAQNQGGVIIVGGVAVNQPDTSAYKVINTIQAEGTALSGNNRFYVTYLVAISKRDSLWQKSKAFYGIIGGTSASHKWNWKDMRDVDGAFRLDFPNGMTHNSNGITGNGTTQYANTFLVASSNLSPSSVHLSAYVKTDNTTGTQVDIGSSNTSSLIFDMILRFSNNVFYFENPTGTTIGSLVSNSLGYNIGNRTATNLLNIWKNGIKLNQSTTSSTTLPTSNIYLLARSNDNNPQFFSRKTFNFFSIGSGLTDTQAIQSSNTVTFAQGILGRK